MSEIPGRPYAGTKIANLIARRIDDLSQKKSQRQIASEIGYDRPNMLSMIKTGDSRVPLEKIPILARVLDIDLVLLLRMAFESYWPDTAAVFAESGVQILTDSERELVKHARDCTGDRVPHLTPEKIEQLKKLLS